MSAQGGLFGAMEHASKPKPSAAPERSPVPPSAPPPRAAPADDTAARRVASERDAINRFAWAVRDLRALGLAGSWKVRLRDGDHSTALTIDIRDDATAERASDAIWGDMQ